MKKTAQKKHTETLTVICPHCGEDFDIQKNGRYVCPECEEYVDVDLFDTPHVHQPDLQTCDAGTYAHWIGIEKFNGKVRVMDPMGYDYSPFSRHEAIRGKRISMCCMIGFVRA